MKNKWLNGLKNGHGQDAPHWRPAPPPIPGNLTNKEALVKWCRAQGILPKLKPLTK